MDFSLDIIIEILLMACGVYMMYWAMQMKQSHKIPEMLVGKGFPINRAKDPEGFIKATFPMTLITGIVLFVGAGFEALEVFILYPVVETVISILIIVFIIAYGYFLMRAQKRYLVGVDPKSNKKL